MKTTKDRISLVKGKYNLKTKNLSIMKITKDNTTAEVTKRGNQVVIDFFNQDGNLIQGHGCTPEQLLNLLRAGYEKLAEEVQDSTLVVS